MSTPHILVIGGGYAGVMAARTALDRGADVTLVDEDGMHGFLPRLATVAAGAGPADDADAPLQDLLPQASIIQARVASLDHEAGKATLEDGSSVTANSIVVAAGAQARPPEIDGLDRFAWTLRTADDARRLAGAIAGAESLVIVGAGSTGTQLAGEVAVAHPRVRVTLAEMTDDLLPSLPSALGRRAHKVLTDRGVDVRLGVRLAEVAPHGAVLEKDGVAEEIAGVVVWAGGFATDGNAVLPKADTVDGRIVVDRACQVPGHGSVFAAGDIAAHRGRGGRVLPQTAQVAVRAGTLAGANAVRVAEGRRPRCQTLKHIGWVLPLGGGQAVAQVGPLSLADPVTGLVAPLMHDVVDLRHLLNVGGIPAITEHHQALSRASDQASRR